MNWLNLLILILIAAGHTELLVTLVNRVHSFPIARPKLRHFRHFDDALIVAFPLLLLWSVGLRGPALLYDGRWSDLPFYWMAYLALCGLGWLGLAWSAIRFGMQHPPAVQISNHTQTVDISKRLGYKPLGTGKLRFLAAVPGNEIFGVRVSDKRYALPKVPKEWHELSILHLTDTHFVGTVERPFFEEIARIGEEMRPDLVVFTGDLLDDRKYLAWLPETLGRLKAPLGCYYILGNHDWWVGSDEVRAEFDRLGWHGVAGRMISLQHRGHTLQIAGTERPWMGVHPEFVDAPGAFRLLLSHTPDHIEWARKHHVDLMLAGHNHGGQVVLPVIGPVFAPSRYGVRYASGAFWSAPTLLYVSRGLSGRHPLRWNCPPELTQIVLQSPAGQPPDGTRSWPGD